ncbi:MAG: A24 family peptidase [bacterium]|nr:A24 family peptidase [bacterium]
MIVDLLLFVTISLSLYTDLRYGKIYNKLTLPIVGLGIVIHGLKGLNGLLFSLGGLTLGIALFFIPFALGWFGAGDVKLLGAIGALKGPKFIFYTVLSTGVFGGILSIINLIKREALFKTCKNLILSLILRSYTNISLDEARDSEKYTYTTAIFLGTIATYVILHLGWELW